MDPLIDVADCLQRWKQGDERAAEELIAHLYPVISRIVRTHLPRRDHEDDIIQEILMKTFSRLHQYKGDAPMSHWVSRLALTTCLDRLRGAKGPPGSPLDRPHPGGIGSLRCRLVRQQDARRDQCHSRP